MVRLDRLLRHFEKTRRDLENSEIKGVETGHLSIRTTVEDPGSVRVTAAVALSPRNGLNKKNK